MPRHFGDFPCFMDKETVLPKPFILQFFSLYFSLNSAYFYVWWDQHRILRTARDLQVQPPFSKKSLKKFYTWILRVYWITDITFCLRFNLRMERMRKTLSFGWQNSFSIRKRFWSLNLRWYRLTLFSNLEKQSWV